jgi:hypothetical protein
MSKAELALAERHARFAQLGYKEQRAELIARIPEGKIEAEGIRTTNCTPGTIEFGDAEQGVGVWMSFENFYSGTRQIDPPGLVAHELRLNITIGGSDGHARIASIPINDPWQCVRAARVLLAVAEDHYPNGDWPDIGYEAAPLVLP